VVGVEMAQAWRRLGSREVTIIEASDRLVAHTEPFVGKELHDAGGWLYAIGDVNGRALLTHMGNYQAGIAVDALLGLNTSDEADHFGVPSVIFTDPQVASVGLTENLAQDRGVDIDVLRCAIKDIAAAGIAGDSINGTCQLIVDRSTGVPVGATFTGPDIGEALHAATVAIVGRVPMSRLRHAVPSFPRFAEIWLELGDAYERGNRTRRANDSGATA
jgi:dihydrolipoamide dehydrogenase